MARFRRYRSELGHDFKNLIYEPFKSMVLLGAHGAMISAGLMLISATLLKIGLKFIKDCEEYKKEKWNKFANHVLKLNIIVLLNSIISRVVFEQNKDHNAIIFLGIVVLSIIEYLFINIYLIRRNKNGSNI